MTAEIHDIVATGDRVGIRATHRGTDEGGFIPGIPATRKGYEIEAIYVVRVNEEGKIAEHWGIVDTMGAMGRAPAAPADRLNRYLTAAPASRMCSRARSPSPGWRSTARMASESTPVGNPSRRASRTVSTTQ
jgi:hypothetical protein